MNCIMINFYYNFLLPLYFLLNSLNASILAYGCLVNGSKYLAFKPVIVHIFAFFIGKLLLFNFNMIGMSSTFENVIVSNDPRLE